MIPNLPTRKTKDEYFEIFQVINELKNNKIS